MKGGCKALLYDSGLFPDNLKCPPQPHTVCSLLVLEAEGKGKGGGGGVRESCTNTVERSLPVLEAKEIIIKLAQCPRVLCLCVCVC